MLFFPGEPPDEERPNNDGPWHEAHDVVRSEQAKADDDRLQSIAPTTARSWDTTFLRNGTARAPRKSIKERPQPTLRENSHYACKVRRSSSKVLPPKR